MPSRYLTFTLSVAIFTMNVRGVICFIISHLEQWAAYTAASGEQSGVRCLAQGSHLSRGQFLPEPRFKPTTSGYKSNALSISPRLPPSYTVFWPNSSIAFIRGVTVHVFVLNMFGTVHIYSIVLTSALVKLLWKLSFIYCYFWSETMPRLSNCQFVSGNSNNKMQFCRSLMQRDINVTVSTKIFSKSAYSNDFWRSCDTEGWSNAENTALHHRLKKKLHWKLF